MRLAERGSTRAVHLSLHLEIPLQGRGIPYGLAHKTFRCLSTHLHSNRRAVRTSCSRLCPSRLVVHLVLWQGVVCLEGSPEQSLVLCTCALHGLIEPRSSGVKSLQLGRSSLPGLLLRVSRISIILLAVRARRRKTSAPIRIRLGHNQIFD